jgi:hypothetical protein
MPLNIQLRRDEAADWESVDPILMEGELGIDLTNSRIKIGNGANTWTELIEAFRIKETFYSNTTTGNVNIDLSNGTVQRFILDANREFTLPADPGALSITLIIETAGFTPVWSSNTTIEWLTIDGVAPPLPTVADKVGVVTFIWDDIDSRYLGLLVGEEK